ncbi:hypothetical protein WJX84_007349 [Apatococcus fuscideae]|uniref:Uncharacterized protein n=1 Tax=Apatococcus fuscideae TaxID=2026836 RepID=A0AAW1T5Y0_9CHLO
MPPKKEAKAKGDEAEIPLEPDSDPDWQRARDSGTWNKSPDVLPDANIWPPWGVLREQILTGCREILVQDCPAVRDAFVAEIIRLSPPHLERLDLSGSVHVTKLVLSPATCCPKLVSLSLRNCPKLQHVLVQSQNLTSLQLSNCAAINKVLLQCNKLESLAMSGCPGISTLMIWSDSLASLTLPDSKDIKKLALYCPALGETGVPAARVESPPARPSHPPIASLLKDVYKQSLDHQQEYTDFAVRMSAESLLNA